MRLSSSAPIWRLTADWLRLSDSPAWVKLPASATAWKIRSLSQSIVMAARHLPPRPAGSDASGRRLYSAAAAAAAADSSPCLAAMNLSASSAAMQPMPAAVTAWRKTRSLTSPAAKTPGMLVAVESGAVRT